MPYRFRLCNDVHSGSWIECKLQSDKHSAHGSTVERIWEALAENVIRLDSGYTLIANLTCWSDSSKTPGMEQYDVRGYA